MSKILLPTPDYFPAKGGVARYLTSIKRILQEDVTILLIQPLPRGLTLYKHILESVKGLSSQSLLTSHLFPIGTIAYLLSHTKRLPYGVILHGMDFDLARRSYLRRLLARKILRRATYLIANSRALASEIEAFSGKKAMVIYPVAQKRFYESMNESTEALSHPFRLITVGRLVKRKGHEKVLHALASIPEVEYWIVGDGEERKYLEQLVNTLKLEHRVTFFGAVEDDELPTLYKGADVFVMPTTKSAKDREGFGIVYLEAQLMGLPVIAVNHPGVNEAVLDGVGGILIEDRQNALIEAIQRLQSDSEFRKNLAQSGRKRILTEFTEKEQFGKFHRIINNL